MMAATCPEVYPVSPPPPLPLSSLELSGAAVAAEGGGSVGSVCWGLSEISKVEISRFVVLQEPPTFETKHK